MKNPKVYYFIVILAVISPIISLYISALLHPNASEVYLGAIIIAIAGVPIVGICGLATSGVFALAKNKNRNFALLGYIIPAVPLCVVILK